MTKTIRIADDTYDMLSNLKGDEETFNDVIARLVQDQYDDVVDGAGLWTGTDAAEQAREVRRSMKREIDS